MNQSIEVALKQAFSLIEAGNSDDARAILRPILESEKENADVWWVYSHAVSDPETARLALSNVLRISPDYPDARELLNQLEEQQQNESFDDIPDFDKEPEFVPAMPSSVPGIKPLAGRGDLASSALDSENPDDLQDERFEVEQEEAFYRRPLFYIPLVVLLLVVALAIVLLKPFAVNSPSSQTPIGTVQSSALEVTPTAETSSAGALTSTPSSTDVTSPTNAAGTTADFSAIAGNFSEFKLASDNGLAIVNTNLGSSLNVSVCTSAGKEMRELLPKAMGILAKASSGYAAQVKAISAKMIDCASNSTLLWIGSSIEDATAFANATLSDKDYQARWKPISSS